MRRPTTPPPTPTDELPDWLPASVRAYLDHAYGGRALRDVAAERGCAASTVLRQVRRIEARRDDPFVDDAMERLGRAVATDGIDEGSAAMSAMPTRAELIDDDTLGREALRILRRLCEGDAFLAVGQGMDQAVILRGESDPTRIATLPRAVAQAFVLKDWIGCYRAGKITRYRITETGRLALRRLLGEKHRRRQQARGRAEAPSPFVTQHGDLVDVGPGDHGTLRINLAESPLGSLARRRDKGGAPFLDANLVLAGETLREDFERAQMGPRVGQNWERFLTAGVKTDPAMAAGGGSDTARARVDAALRALGPGLGDVALRVCCFLEGIEAAEKRMGWAARSGKVVLRIALQRLSLHYTEVGRL